jgi:hypothetical protein
MRSLRHRSFCSVKTKSYVVGHPIAVGIAQHGLEESNGVGEGGCSIGYVEAVENAIAECVEPGLHTSGEWRGAWDKFD